MAGPSLQDGLRKSWWAWPGSATAGSRGSELPLELQVQVQEHRLSAAIPGSEAAPSAAPAAGPAREPGARVVAAEATSHQQRPRLTSRGQSPCQGPRGAPGAWHLIWPLLERKCANVGVSTVGHEEVATTLGACGPGGHGAPWPRPSASSSGRPSRRPCRARTAFAVSHTRPAVRADERVVTNGACLCVSREPVKQGPLPSCRRGLGPGKGLPETVVLKEPHRPPLHS